MEIAVRANPKGRLRKGYTNWKMEIAVQDSLAEWKRNIYNNKNRSTRVQVFYEKIIHWLKAPAKFTF